MTRASHAVVVPERLDDTFMERFRQSLRSTEIECIEFTITEGVQWNSATLASIRMLGGMAHEHGKATSSDGLPSQAARVLALARPPAQPETITASPGKPDILTRIGITALAAWQSARTIGAFIGEVGRSVARMLSGHAQFQSRDLIQFMRDTGPQAIPLVGLVNLLLGVILAFMGAIQLQQFGAQIFVADLVAIGLTREIAPMMTAIILAGRTGAAYAAQLGTMQVNEEIDAFRTFGFSPIDFLVLPRMLALAVMTPLLVLYADAIGMFGGFLVGVLLLDIGGPNILPKRAMR